MVTLTQLLCFSGPFYYIPDNQSPLRPDLFHTLTVLEMKSCVVRWRPDLRVTAESHYCEFVTCNRFVSLIVTSVAMLAASYLSISVATPEGSTRWQQLLVCVCSILLHENPVSAQFFFN